MILRFRPSENRLRVSAVKVILVLLASLIAAQATPSDPGAVAIDFLEKVRSGKLNLHPGGDTALSPQTADGKKRKIAKTIERMARDLADEDCGESIVEFHCADLERVTAKVACHALDGFGDFSLFAISRLR
jgi:hypothetical protein